MSDDVETYTREQLETALGVLSGRLDSGDTGVLDRLGFAGRYPPSPDRLKGAAEEVVVWWILRRPT